MHRTSEIDIPDGYDKNDFTSIIEKLKKITRFTADYKTGITCGFYLKRHDFERDGKQFTGIVAAAAEHVFIKIVER